MKLNIVKWGNSLAVRIPAEYARQMGLKEGDTVQASVETDGTLMLRTKSWDRKAFSETLEKFRKSLKMGSSVIDELRRDR